MRGAFGFARSSASACGVCAALLWTAAAPAAAERPTELTELRSEHSRTVGDGQGIFRTTVSAEPMHFRDGRGQWRRIDTRLRRSRDRIVNGANRFDVSLPAEQASGNAIVRTRGAWIRFRLRGADARARMIAGGVRYRGSLPGVTTIYEPLAEGIKETLRLSDARAARSLVFDVQLSRGAQLRAAADGSLRAVRGGRTRFMVEAPYMVDAAGVRSDAVRYELRRSGVHTRLRVVPDQRWLRSAERRFPVDVDPTVLAVIPREADCTIASGASANQTFCGTSTLLVGRDSTRTYRSLLRFNVAAAVPQAIDVHGAQLTLEHSSGGSGPSAIGVHAVTRGWNTSATWNRYDGAATWTTPGADHVAARESSSTSIRSPEVEDWLIRDLAQRWIDGTTPNHGVLLKALDESRTGVVNLRSGESTATDRRPRLVITYSRRTGILPRYHFHGDEPQEPAPGDEDPPPEDPTEVHVNVGNGNLVLVDRRVRVEATGPDIVYNQTYNGLAGTWASTDGVYTSQLHSDAYHYVGPTGEVVTLRRDGGAGFLPSPELPGTWTTQPSRPGVPFQVELDDEIRLTVPGQEISAVEDPDGAGYRRVREGDNPNYHWVGTDAGLSVEIEPIGYSGISRIVESPGGGANVWETLSNPTRYRFTDSSGRVSEEYYSGDRLVRFVDRTGDDLRFTYDASGRTTSVKRVTDPATSSGPTTTYSYGPGRTDVTDPDGTVTTYHSDGKSIVRRAEQGTGVPALTLSGPLAAADGTTLDGNTQYQLQITATDPQGIDNIEVKLDGDSEADTDESPCPATTTCSFTWTLDPQQMPPGELVLNVWAEDRTGAASMRTLLVTSPVWDQTSGPAAPPPPTQEERYARAFTFRTELGFPADEATIAAMDTDPAAQAAAFEYGVPLAAAEAQDVAVREEVQHDASAIESYVRETPAAAEAYAGSYIDQANGGTVHVGFTQDAAHHMDEIAERFDHPARLRSFTPTLTRDGLEALSDRVSDDWDELTAGGIPVHVIFSRVRDQAVYVGVPSPTAQMQATLRDRYGPNVRLLRAEPGGDDQNLDRFATYRRIMPGLQLTMTAVEEGGCTASYSVFEPRRRGRRYHLTTAGHCGDQGVRESWYQGGRFVGRETRNFQVDFSDADVQIIQVPRRRTSNRLFGPAWRRAITAVESIRRHEREGQLVCMSGRVSGIQCGPLKNGGIIKKTGDGVVLHDQRFAQYDSRGGDSGAPIYTRTRNRTARAVGWHQGWERVFEPDLDPPRAFIDYRVYGHASNFQNERNMFVCYRGRARCGR
jgi:YD repeat-containing protein